MGFWSSLASIGASLIPGIGPIIAPVVGGLVGTLTGGSGQGGNTGVNQQAQQSIQLPKFQSDPGVSAAEGFYRSALNGNQATEESLLGPQVSTVLSQYDNAAKTAANLGPRGGGRTAILAEAPFKKAGAYGQALAGVQSGAAKDLGEISLNDQGQKNNYTEKQGELNLGQNKIQYEGQQAANKQASSVGGGIANILTSIIGGKKNPVTAPAFDGGGGFGGSSGTDNSMGGFGG